MGQTTCKTMTGVNGNCHKTTSLPSRIIRWNAAEECLQIYVTKCFLLVLDTGEGSAALTPNYKCQPRSSFKKPEDLCASFLEPGRLSHVSACKERETLWFASICGRTNDFAQDQNTSCDHFQGVFLGFCVNVKFGCTMLASKIY